MVVQGALERRKAPQGLTSHHKHEVGDRKGRGEGTEMLCHKRKTSTANANRTQDLTYLRTAIRAHVDTRAARRT